MTRPRTPLIGYITSSFLPTTDIQLLSRDCENSPSPGFRDRWGADSDGSRIGDVNGPIHLSIGYVNN
ncbi:hypothetical protein J6590_001548 [Homalodisca vitripennis]|nr:hypothetical protein J6590_001548 [Homalodisca vitripennis]